MEIKDRIRLIMEEQHMTQQSFADFLKQSPATLSSIFNDRTRPTLQFIDAIKHKIPTINIEWLLYGTGEMYAASQEDVSEESALSPTGEPMLQFDAPQAAPVPQKAAPTVVAKIIDKEPRRVTEIRVYYDDQTYESFVPSKH